MKEHNAEIKVGAFVLISLLVIAGLIISFGNFDQLFQKSYTIHADFSDASGIIKDAQVHYRGAKVGNVLSTPEISSNGDTVRVDLRIRSDVRIDKRSEFQIGSHGMLGDLYIDIIPPKFPPGVGEKITYLKDGDVVTGTMGGGLADLIAEAKDKLQKFDAMIVDIKTKIITDKFITDFHESVANARELLDRGNRFMAEAEQGKGPLYVLMKDQATAAKLKKTVTNLNDLIYNLKKTGVLFYHDLADREKQDADSKDRH